jgi:hypothetical protein
MKEEGRKIVNTSILNFILHPSSFILFLSVFILHPSSFILFSASQKEALNQKLAQEVELAQSSSLEFGNGKLDYDIGNAYFRLEEYPLAIWYYYKALKLRPYDPVVQNNLNRALKELRLPEESAVYAPPLPLLLQILAALSLLVFFIWSIYVWFPSKVLFKMTCGTTVILICFIFFLGYRHYFSPLEGVMIRSSMLYEGLNQEKGMISHQPIPSGTKVTVLEVLEEGKWLKVVDQDGNLGYVPNSKIRLI